MSRSAPPPHAIDIRVYYEDTDAAGIVYYANYLRFAERARSEMLRGLGFSQARLRGEEGRGFAVRRCTADYLLPARLDDLVTVETRVTGVGAAALGLEQRIRRDRQSLVVIDILLACIGREGRPRRLPPALRAAIAQRFPTPTDIVQKTP